MKDFDNKLNDFFADLKKKIDNTAGIVAETAITHFKERFEVGNKNWDGETWKPYGNPLREPKRGSLMYRNAGGLQSSIQGEVISASRGRVFTRKPYARIHNEGGRVRAVQYVKPHYNNNFMGRGKRVQIKGFARKLDFVMPKRQFMGKSTMLLEAIKTRFKNDFKTT